MVMRTLLLILLAFVTVSSLVSGSLLFAYSDGSLLWLSVSLLNGTPFESFFVPGIVLAIAVGGVHLLALVLITREHSLCYNWAMTAAVILTGWTFVQIVLVGSMFGLSYVYLILGFLIFFLSWQLKGKLAEE